MKKMRKLLLCGALSAFTVFACAGVMATANEYTAEAAVATEYTTVEVGVSVRISPVYDPNGNFNLNVTLDQLDTEIVNEYQSISGLTKEGISLVFEQLGFFDSVKIGNKTLRQLGCTSFYDVPGYNTIDLKHSITLHCHADPDTWQAAVASKEVDYSTALITVEKGTAIPSYTYLSGAANAVLYRASCTWESQEVGSSFAYNRKTYGSTDIEDLKYTQAFDGANAYLGISLFGDDYLGNGQQVECDVNAANFYVDFAETILINGEQGKVKYYGLYNLGEAGAGYYSFAVTVSEEECQSITIPAGTMFPSRMMDDSTKINAARLFVVYKTTETCTYYKNADGQFVALESYAKDKVTALQTERNNRADADYFPEDVTAMDTLLAQAQQTLAAATSVAEIDAAYADIYQAFTAIQSKEMVKESAIAEVNAYKSQENYFRAEEEAQRAGYAQTAVTAINAANSKSAITEAVNTAKTQIDNLKTAAQYADELLGPAKAEANAEIQNFMADKAYLEEQAPLREQAIQAGLQAVKEAIDEDGIAQAVIQAKAAILEIPTKDDFIAGYMEELTAYKAGEFRPEQEAQKTEIITMAIAEMQAATTANGMAETAFIAFAVIDELKTSAQYLSEEKVAANQIVNEKKATLNYDDYSVEDQTKINELFRDTKLVIETATTAEEVNAAAQNFVNTVNKLSKISSDKGCGASVMGIGGVLAMLTAVGAAVALKKKED